MPVLSKADLKAGLAQFTGTELWYRSINRAVTYTDGVKYFADSAGAHWLIDILATELASFARTFDIVFITASVADTKARLFAVEDKGLPPLWERHISYTDCPPGEWGFYMARGGPNGTIVIMLPSEY